MLKNILIGFLSVALFCSLLLTGIGSNSADAADYSLSTNVGGILNEDITWTLEGSPYMIIDTVQIPENVVLTIEPGVTIIDERSVTGGGPSPFLFSGEINAKGTPETRIKFIGNDNSGLFRPIGDDSGRLYIEYCEISGSCLFSSESDTLAFLEIKNSTVFTPPSSWGGLLNAKTRAAPALIEFNIFVGGRLFINDFFAKPPIIKNNLFLVCSDFSIQSFLEDANGIIKYNSFLGLNPNHNRIFYTSELDITENYWGTSDTDFIDAIIVDRNDSILYSGHLNYLPILTEPHPDTPTAPLIVDFSFSPSQIYAKGTFTLDASASYGIFTSIKKYDWDFGDGNNISSMTTIVTHNYAVPDNYTVTLTITDEFGFKNTTTKDIIALQDIISPVLNITYPDSDSEINSLNITITWNCIDEGSGIDRYEIRLDDGTWINVEKNNSHAFKGLSDGNHTVEIKAIDNAGNERQEAVGFYIDTSSSLGSSDSGFGYLEIAIIVIICIAAFGTVLYCMKFRKK